MLLDGVLPLNEEASEKTSVIVEGVEAGYISIPLHTVHLKTDFVSGPASVGIVNKIPVDGVQLLGNDLAGDHVKVAPQVC